MLPSLSGRPIRVELRDSLGPHHAATSIPKRVILLDAELLARRGEFERILIHEIFHFAWLRLSNTSRRSWEGVLEEEIAGRARGELGWSAESRKQKLLRRDRIERSKAWRLYSCEGFCDTAAWLYSGLRTHDEFTLSPQFRRRRREWFHATFPASRAIPI